MSCMVRTYVEMHQYSDWLKYPISANSVCTKSIRSDILYMAKHSRGKTFTVGMEKGPFTGKRLW